MNEAIPSGLLPRCSASAWWAVAFLLVAGLAARAETGSEPARIGSSSASLSRRPIARVPPGALLLRENWRLRSSHVVREGGERISRVGYPTATWHRATVPTTVLRALVRRGLYPDPYVGLGNLRIPDAHAGFSREHDLARYSHLADKSNPWAEPYWFRTEFRLPRQWAGKTVWLVFAGINYRADVWLDGERIADSREVAGMFRRFRFDVTGRVKVEGPNALAVRVHPVDPPGDPKHAQTDLMGSFGPNGGDGEIQRSVTMACSVGWDWVPAARDRNMGIWQDVWLEATGPVVVRDPMVVTDLPLPDVSRADLTVRFDLENASAKEREVELGLRIEPVGFRAPPVELEEGITVAPRSTRDVVLGPKQHPGLTLRSPRLWWPVTYGAPRLYRLTITAELDGALSSRVGRRFGVREVSFDVSAKARGCRALRLNGRKIRITGGAWIPDFLLGWDARRYEDEARLIAEGNHVMVRINGCSITAPDVFLDACDRLGVLVWQELWRTSTSAGWYPKECDAKLFLRCARDAIKRLRFHPSLVIWGAANEACPQRDIVEPLTEFAGELDGTRLLLPASHGDGPEWAEVKPFVYTGGPWRWVPETYWFEKFASDPKFGFRDEVGAASIPPPSSVARFLREESPAGEAWFPVTAEMSYHDATGGYRPGHRAIYKRFGRPATSTEYLCMGQFLDADSHRAIFEAMNLNLSTTAGTLLWKTNAAWPSFMWQTFDWYLRPNAGYYAMKRACRPLHVQLDQRDRSVWVVSTLAPGPGKLRVAATSFNAEGTVLHEATGELVVNDEGVFEALRLPASALPADRLCLVRLTLEDLQGHERDRNVYWVSASGDFRTLRDLPPLELQVRARPAARDGPESVVTVELAHRGPSVALLVNPAVLKGAQGLEVLPSFWSDNYVTLFAGERRRLTVRYRTERLEGKAPHLLVEGWNVTPRELDLTTGRDVTPSFTLSRVDRSPDPGTGAATPAFALQSEGSGSHLTTWPVELPGLGGKRRVVRVGARAGERVAIPAPPPTPLRASASTSVAGFAPELAFDGNLATRWSSEVLDDQWLALDLGEPRAVRAVELQWQEAYAKAYEIQVSEDGESWRTVVRERAGNGKEDRHAFEPVTARHVRMRGRKRGTGGGLSLWEMTVLTGPDRP